MPLAPWISIATLVAVPFASIGAENPRSTDPADPAAPASPFRYESVFNHYQSIAESEEAPDKAWRAANDEMGRLGGHAGHIKAVPALPQSKTMSVDQNNHGMHQKNKGQ